MTVNPDFKDTPLFDIEYLRNDFEVHAWLLYRPLIPRAY